MKREVASAVDFLTQLMRSSARKSEALSIFNDALKRRISDHYRNHWFPEKPFKGSGYRCLRINHNMEPIILQAAAESGLTRDDLISMLPNELTLWIDPREVSYRIGEDGSVGILYEEEAQDTRNNNKLKQASSQGTPSPINQSPCQSPSRPSSANSTSSGEVSWDIFDHSLSPSRPHFGSQSHHQVPSLQCGREAAYSFHQQTNLNDVYDWKRLAAYVSS